MPNWIGLLVVEMLMEWILASSRVEGACDLLEKVLISLWMVWQPLGLPWVSSQLKAQRH